MSVRKSSGEIIIKRKGKFDKVIVIKVEGESEEKRGGIPGEN